MPIKRKESLAYSFLSKTNHLILVSFDGDCGNKKPTNVYELEVMLVFATMGLPVVFLP